ncbi:MAG TPA: bifunctional DNA-formamidopyrimidine glycosylase/DNA-(apurinic or apyrimidinic site) lyase [Patescibacteria group bacterium]|nr:bifunctional DNA-formamidopyrimidine glycosylase/DNA-(apurinic or apyrimidinic site) lyase [Patescibacteria group bacterium]
MPELPEVQTVVSELNRKLKGLTIQSVAVNAPKMVAVGPAVVSNIRRVSGRKAAEFVRLLRGRKILGVRRRAKLLIFDLSAASPRPRRASGPLSLLVHLKMTGQFIFEDRRLRQKTGGRYRLFNNAHAPQVELPSKHTHVIIKFAGGSTLYFNDIRKFGYLKLVRGDMLDQVRELREYGPEPFDKKFTPAIFASALRRRGKSPVKLALMDPKVVAGIGNIYSDEILFHAKVRPARRTASLSRAEEAAIFRWIRPVLRQAIAAKGSSVGDFVRTDGSWGGMGKFHFVYGRRGQKCKRCGTLVAAVKLGGRTASYCPHCQK